MGEKRELTGREDAERMTTFMQRLLEDVSTLERMLREDRIESGVYRIGAELEYLLVHDACRPSPINLQVLKALDDDHFTTELARFNVELNLDPLSLEGTCLSQLHGQLKHYTDKLRRASAGFDTEVVLAGILPTLRLQDLDEDSMTPLPRYHALNRAINGLRGRAFELRIHGADELMIRHDTVMLEACNTSFQIHLQVDPHRFAPFYNAAQAIAGPTLAAAANSPLLFGRRLWRETRIAVFQQAVDTRTSSYYLQDTSSRVHFGRRWVRESALELFQEDIARFRVLLGTDKLPESPSESLKAGRVPQLRALQLHNSTVYRWNRPCYGISDGKPHLRIENRIFPAGPTLLDQVANAAFWFGLVHGLVAEVGDVAEHQAFTDARANFLAAARQGLGAQFAWLGGRVVPAKELILDNLLPMARRGLAELELDPGDVDRYLGVIEARVSTGRTGAHWSLESLDRMGGKGTLSQKLNALTASAIPNQIADIPVHEWPLARLDAVASSSKHAYARIEQIMTTDVVTITKDEIVDLVGQIMSWHNIRYVPVVDYEGHLEGLVSHRGILRYLTRGDRLPNETVAAIMHREEVVTVAPETLTLDALALMRECRVGCLPVVKNNVLVGIVSERNFMTIAGQLLEEKLREPSPSEERVRQVSAEGPRLPAELGPPL
ncbi:MAG: CBS domain-containing protein [Planctomycetes bacterium]|nr:CBS domain-containing protein [Planctomycetota bacterium]